ncbi:MAG: DUF4160 domain-containing protein [Magnetococcales bacterium]|nr:DUF4160 domain-containing protein [Magnetococcales bacterium]
MPTIWRTSGFRVYFYSHEPNEPAHVHVDKDGRSAKFWLDPLQLSWNMGYTPKELTQVRSLLLEHRERLLESWYGYFGNQSG